MQDVLSASAATDQASSDAAWANLAGYPELTERMRQSPQWLADLGNAWLSQPGDVMAVVQTLRQRAAAAGTVTAGVYPAVQYYNPWVVYGAYWRPAYRPVYWRPWHARPAFVTRVVVGRPAFQTHVRIYSQPYRRVPESRRAPIVQSRAAPVFHHSGFHHPGGRRR